MGKLSPEAARLKYEYNRKYQERYWEKKAAQQQNSPKQEQDNAVSVSRKDMNDNQYIMALEKSNKVLNSENRRLIRLLHKYQVIISQAKVTAL